MGRVIKQVLLLHLFKTNMQTKVKMKDESVKKVINTIKQVKFQKTQLDYSFLINPYTGYCIYRKKEDSNPAWSSLEKFNVSKLLILHEYLIDKIEREYLLLDNEQFLWLQLNLKRINDLLTGERGNFFCSNSYVYHKVTYKQTRHIEDIRIGKLYPSKNSYVNLPREIRSFLINFEYSDYAMVNSHPSLLLEYSVKNINKTPPLLYKYVHNKDEFLKEKSKIDKTSIKQAQKDILVCLNTSEAHATSMGYKAKDFWREVSFIRDHIYESMFIQDSELYKYTSDDLDFKNKTLEKKKRAIQSLYLQTLEMDYLYKLVVFLKNFIKNKLKEENVDLSDYKNNLQYGLLFDRDVNVDDIFYVLTCIPVFDGLYIGCEIPIYKEWIDEGVKAFNKTVLNHDGVFVRFKKKEFEKKYKYIDKDILNIYSELRNYINSLSTRKFNELLEVLNIKPINFENLPLISSFDLDTDSNKDDQDTRLLQILYVCREFRRNIYDRIKEELSKDSDLILNDDFLKKLQLKYESSDDDSDF